jgi:hypothetical protein
MNHVISYYTETSDTTRTIMIEPIINNRAILFKKIFSLCQKLPKKKNKIYESNGHYIKE